MERRKTFNDIMKVLFSLLLGGLILYWMYRDFDFKNVGRVLVHEMDWTWMLLSFPFGVLAQMLRGWRWQMSLEPIGEHARASVSVNSIFLSYAVSLVVPRVGEFARCGVLKRYDGVSFTKALGTVVTERIIELGDKKELVTQEDLPYIVSDVLKHDVRTERVKLKSYIVNLAHGLKPMATIKVEINGKEYEENSSGDGQYDAFVRALRKVYKGTLGRRFPMLTNYAVSIPPGGRTDAFVQTVITWSFDDKVFRTRGLDADQTEAAIKATMKMLNLIEDGFGEPSEPPLQNTGV